MRRPRRLSERIRLPVRKAALAGGFFQLIKGFVSVFAFDLGNTCLSDTLELVDVEDGGGGLRPTECRV